MYLIRCDVMVEPIPPARISDVSETFKFKFKTNDRSALWDTFGKLDGTKYNPTK